MYPNMGTLDRTSDSATSAMSEVLPQCITIQNVKFVFLDTVRINSKISMRPLECDQIFLI